MTRLRQEQLRMLVLIAIGLVVVGTGAAYTNTSESVEIDGDPEINTLSNDIGVSFVLWTDFEWSLEFDELLLQWPTEHLPSLLTQTKSMPPNSRHLKAQDEIFRCFASRDAHGAMKFANEFSTLLRSRFVDVVLSEWAMNDLEGALEFAASLSLNHERKNALERIVEIRDDLSRDYLRRAMRDHGLEEFLGGERDVTKRYGFTRDPEAAWLDILDNGSDYVNDSRELQTLARAWIDDDGLEVLHRIDDSIPYWSVRQSLLKTALTHASKNDPSAAFTKALDMFVDSNWDLILTVAKSWTGQDRDAAVDAFQAVESDALRQRLLDVVTEQLIRDNPQLLLERPEMLPDALRAIGPYGTVTLIDNLTPEVATRLIGEVEAGMQAFAGSLISRMATENFDEALAWVLDTPVSRGDLESRLNALLDKADEDKTVRAVEAILSRSTNDDGEIGLEAHAIGLLAQRNPNRAQRMLSRVRDGQTRLIAYASVGLGFLHHNRHNRALALGLQLSGSQQLKYYDGIYEIWTESNPKRAYSNVDRLPSVEAKSRGALWLLKRNFSNSVLSERQTRRLEGLLIKEDEQQLTEQQE